MSGLEIPLIAAEGMGGAAALDSLLINAGLPSLAGGLGTEVAGGLLGASAAKTPAQMAMAQMGMGMLGPQQPMQMPQSPPPMPGQQGALSVPHNQGLMGSNSMSDSLPPPGMPYEEWLRRKQQQMMMGGVR